MPGTNLKNKAFRQGEALCAIVMPALADVENRPVMLTSKVIN